MEWLVKKTPGKRIYLIEFIEQKAWFRFLQSEMFSLFEGFLYDAFY